MMQAGRVASPDQSTKVLHRSRGAGLQRTATTAYRPSPNPSNRPSDDWASEIAAVTMRWLAALGHATDEAVMGPCDAHLDHMAAAS
jgi:hypothetical protein